MKTDERKLHGMDSNYSNGHDPRIHSGHVIERHLTSSSSSLSSSSPPLLPPAPTTTTTADHNDSNGFNKHMDTFSVSTDIGGSSDSAQETAAAADTSLISNLETVKKNRRCFSSRKQLSIPKDLPKEIRKYYKDQNALIEGLEAVWLSVEGGDDSHARDERRVVKLASVLSKITFATNLLLLLAKAVAAGLSASLVMISSMLDSAMDLVSGALMWWSNRAIKNTNYTLYPRGRRKLEPVAIVMLAVIMSFVSVQVIHESIQTIVIYATKNYDEDLQRITDWMTMMSSSNRTDSSSSSSNGTLLTEALDLIAVLSANLKDCASSLQAPIFETPTIAICLATVATKLVLYLICRRIDNPSVQALAKDHLNDVFSNSGAIACGIIGYQLWKYADPLGAIIISLSIIINWSVTAHVQIKMLTGYTARPDFVQKVTWIVLNHDDRIQYIESVIAFHFGSRFLVEVSIVLPGDMSMRESHDLCDALQVKIERLPEVERAFVHIDYESDWIVKNRSSQKITTRLRK